MFKPVGGVAGRAGCGQRGPADYRATKAAATECHPPAGPWSPGNGRDPHWPPPGSRVLQSPPEPQENSYLQAGDRAASRCDRLAKSRSTTHTQALVEVSHTRAAHTCHTGGLQHNCDNTATSPSRRHGLFCAFVSPGPPPDSRRPPFPRFVPRRARTASRQRPPPR